MCLSNFIDFYVWSQNLPYYIDLCQNYKFRPIPKIPKPKVSQDILSNCNFLTSQCFWATDIFVLFFSDLMVVQNFSL